MSQYLYQIPDSNMMYQPTINMMYTVHTTITNYKFHLCFIFQEIWRLCPLQVWGARNSSHYIQWKPCKGKTLYQKVKWLYSGGSGVWYCAYQHPPEFRTTSCGVQRHMYLLYFLFLMLINAYISTMSTVLSFIYDA